MATSSPARELGPELRLCGRLNGQERGLAQVARGRGSPRRRRRSGRSRLGVFGRRALVLSLRSSEPKRNALISGQAREIIHVAPVRGREERATRRVRRGG